MFRKVKKYLKFVVCCALILSLIAPSYAALSASDGSAFVTKAEFDSALADFNARLTTFEAGINSKIDSQVTSYLDRNGIWNGAPQLIEGMEITGYSTGETMTLPRFWCSNMVGVQGYRMNQKIYFNHVGEGVEPTSEYMTTAVTGIDYSKPHMLYAGPFAVQRLYSTKLQGQKDVVIKKINKSGLLRFTFLYSAMGGNGIAVTNTTKSGDYDATRSDILMMDSTSTNGIRLWPLTQLYRELRSNPNSNKLLTNYSWPGDVVSYGSMYLAYTGMDTSAINDFTIKSDEPKWTNRAFSYQGGVMWYLNDQELYFDPFVDWSGVQYQIPTSWGLGTSDAWFTDGNKLTDLQNLYQSGGAFVVPFNCSPKQKTWYTFVSKNDEISLKMTELNNGRLGTSSGSYWGWTTGFLEWSPVSSERRITPTVRMLGLQVTDAVVY